jgi:hypothetical protein
MRILASRFRSMVEQTRLSGEYFGYKVGVSWSRAMVA